MCGCGSGTASDSLESKTWWGVDVCVKILAGEHIGSNAVITSVVDASRLVVEVDDLGVTTVLSPAQLKVCGWVSVPLGRG